MHCSLYILLLKILQIPRNNLCAGRIIAHRDHSAVRCFQKCSEKQGEGEKGRKDERVGGRGRRELMSVGCLLITTCPGSRLQSVMTFISQACPAAGAKSI